MRARDRLGVGAAVALTAALLLWWQGRPDGRLHLIFPALRGDSLLIVTPGGRTVLVDGGQDPADLPLLLGRRLPAWQRTLDVLVLTHADPQRLPGLLAVARRYNVRAALLAAAPQSQEERALVTLLHQHGAGLRVARAGDLVDLDGVRLRVYAAGKRYLALRLRYGSFAALLAPAAQSGDMAWLPGRPAQLLFYPWQGHDDRALADRIGARYVIYSEGQIERNMPQRSTYFERGGTYRRLLHERLVGQIELTSDGAQTVLKTERP